MWRVARLLGAVSMALAVTAVSTAVATPAPFSAADDALRVRVDHDNLSGGLLVVGHDDTIVHQYRTGSTRAGTVMPIASASKWLTAATLMTFVDDGTLALDDPVSRHLPAFGGGKAMITVRQLLSHTTGLPSASCEGDPTTTLRRCVASIASGPDPYFTPGSEFHYSGVGFAVAGRLVERLSGTSFEEAFETRIARPLGMRHTRFDGTSKRHNRNPSPAASARSSVDDYTRFLRMLAADGTFAGDEILRPGSVAEIERDQVAGLDTHDDGAVQITGIPTYGLGVWRDEVNDDDAIEVVSGSGALGFYPWIDRVHGTYGIVAVDDEYHGAEHAVPASQRIARMLWETAA
jgi:CubicO group peptidase (beta-lactamase class C family)